jgi:hypothetical protein
MRLAAITLLILFAVCGCHTLPPLASLPSLPEMPPLGPIATTDEAIRIAINKCAYDVRDPGARDVTLWKAQMLDDGFNVSYDIPLRYQPSHWGPTSVGGTVNRTGSVKCYEGIIISNISHQVLARAK